MRDILDKHLKDTLEDWDKTAKSGKITDTTVSGTLTIVGVLATLKALQPNTISLLDDTDKEKADV